MEMTKKLLLLLFLLFVTHDLLAKDIDDLTQQEAGEKYLELSEEVHVCIKKLNDAFDKYEYRNDLDRMRVERYLNLAFTRRHKAYVKQIYLQQEELDECWKKLKKMQSLIESEKVVLLSAEDVEKYLEKENKLKKEQFEKKFPLSLQEKQKALEKEAEEKYGEIKEGHEITVYATISGSMRKITGKYYGKSGNRILIGNRQIPIFDMSEESQLRFDKARADARRKIYIKQEFEKYRSARKKEMEQNYLTARFEQGFVYVKGSQEPVGLAELFDTYVIPLETMLKNIRQIQQLEKKFPALKNGESEHISAVLKAAYTELTNEQALTQLTTLKKRFPYNSLISKVQKAIKDKNIEKECVATMKAVKQENDNEKVIKTLGDLIRKYPDSKYTESARVLYLKVDTKSAAAIEEFPEKMKELKTMKVDQQLKQARVLLERYEILPVELDELRQTIADATAELDISEAINKFSKSRRHSRAIKELSELIAKYPQHEMRQAAEELKEYHDRCLNAKSNLDFIISYYSKNCNWALRVMDKALRVYADTPYTAKAKKHYAVWQKKAQEEREAVLAREREIQEIYERTGYYPCGACGGSGRAGGYSRQTPCDVCNGSGGVKDRHY